MDLLLDTHVFLWWDGRHPSLSREAAEAIAEPSNTVFVSAASVWEIAIKVRAGKLEIAGSAADSIPSNGFSALPILPADSERVGSLDWPHRDPFDRMLVAQAERLSLTLVTADARIRQYGGVAQLWAGGA